MSQAGDDSWRLILYHKQGTSARTRFLRYVDDTVLAFTPLPTLAQRIDETLPGLPEPVLSWHPATVLQQAEQALGLPAGSIEFEAEYREQVDTANGTVAIYLGRVTTIDPPFAAAESLQARFIDLTQARDLPAVELELLRRAYEVIMEG